MGRAGAGAFGTGTGGSGRTLGLALPLGLSPPLSRSFVGIGIGIGTGTTPANVDVGVGGSGCVGGGESGGPRGCVERGRGRRGANMSSELNSGRGRGDRCAYVRGNTGSARLRPLSRELPLSRAARPGKLLRKRSRKDGRRVGSGAAGCGLFEGGGGGGAGGRNGELGGGAGTGSAGVVDGVGTAELGCCSFALSSSAMRRLSARLRHSTVNTISPQMTRTTGGTMAAVSTPPDALLGCRRAYQSGKSRGKSGRIGGTHEEEDDGTSTSLISVDLRISGRGDMLYER